MGWLELACGIRAHETKLDLSLDVGGADATFQSYTDQNKSYCSLGCCILYSPSEFHYHSVCCIPRYASPGNLYGTTGRMNHKSLIQRKKYYYFNDSPTFSVHF